MELKVNIQVSVDGVFQSNGGRHPDFDPGMDRGGWARPLFDDESLTYVGNYYQRADAFLFGRRTYEIFNWSWGTGTWGADHGNNPISNALNTRPKYVASMTLTEPTWSNTTVLSGNLASAVRDLKAQPGRELQVHGSGMLARWLLMNDLVDELTLLVAPVIVGQGERLFPDSGPDLALDLVETRAFPKGIVLQTYRPAGRPYYASD
ncbi:dihydrofolate reductase family protein [Haloactinopolyspora sp.]|uniref:dihydrofolate reductase family protein n=1 Tax=Haloactinopolyspora sp. TaxID=1966353 RepID=UPI00262E3FDE|nr:dihydrofolate reductase family protein [Haloactinopolyspora sp.]